MNFADFDKLLNYSVSIKMFILIVVLYYILCISTIHSCCNKGNNIGSLEGMENRNKNTTTSTTTIPKPSVPPSSVQSGSGKKTEGFVGANTNYGESSAYSLAHTKPLDTSKWGAQTLTVSGNNVSPAAQAIINRPNQSFPLPEGQLSMFDNMPFSPECCPNTYSTSMGCACMNSNTYNYLITRGGNNQPYSEY
jgi:hypothetical protein